MSSIFRGSAVGHLRERGEKIQGRRKIESEFVLGVFLRSFAQIYKQNNDVNGSTDHGCT